MPRKSVLFLSIFNLLCIATVNSQSKDDNIIINHQVETYTFRQNKGEVNIMEETEVNYECLKASTISFVKFYDNKSEVPKVKIKGIKGIEPNYAMYQSGELFYTDAKVCYFKLPFSKMGETAQVSVNMLHKDPHYFTSIYLSESEFVKNKTVNIVVPEWMNIEISEWNLGDNVTRSITEDKNNTKTYTYQIANQKADKREPNMPGRSHIYPHLLVLVKSANINGEKITFFETVQDRYKWCYDLTLQMNNDEPLIAVRAKDIVKDCKTDEEKIKALYGWVQDNIRYIAFEDGIAGFKPDDAQEVLRKKYGDCKGMSNLLKAMLTSQGFDARLTWIGTNHIAYDYTLPSLAVDNHMICALFWNNKLYFLDPTVSYMPLGENPQTIQGREAQIENKDKYILEKVPIFAPNLNTDSVYCEYTIVGDQLEGNAVNTYRGESKQIILSLINATQKNMQEESLRNFLERGVVGDKVTDIKLTGDEPQTEMVSISYKEKRKSELQAIDNEYYIGLDSYKDLLSSDINIDKRKNDILHPYRAYMVREVALNIPLGCSVKKLPETLTIDNDKYTFLITYTQEGNKIIYKKKLEIKDALLKKENFEQWNKDITALRKACMEQIVLLKN